MLYDALYDVWIEKSDWSKILCKNFFKEIIKVLFQYLLTRKSKMKAVYAN